MSINNEQIKIAAQAAIDSLRAQHCHVYGNMADAIYSGLWDAINVTAPYWEDDDEDRRS